MDLKLAKSLDEMDDGGTASNNLAPDPLNQLDELESLLDFAGPAQVSRVLSPPNSMGINENDLVQVRLGIASSLFTALKLKDSPTASHCLRVALGCSA